MAENLKYPPDRRNDMIYLLSLLKRMERVFGEEPIDPRKARDIASAVGRLSLDLDFGETHFGRLVGEVCETALRTYSIAKT